MGKRPNLLQEPPLSLLPDLTGSGQVFFTEGNEESKDGVGF